MAWRAWFLTAAGAVVVAASAWGQAGPSAPGQAEQWMQQGREAAGSQPPLKGGAESWMQRGRAATVSQATSAAMARAQGDDLQRIFRPMRMVGEAVVARLPAKRTAAFQLVTNDDLSLVAGIDQWEEGELKKWYIAVNGRVWEFYDAVDAASAQFSGDALYVLAMRQGQWYVVCNDREIRKLGSDECSRLLVSPPALQHAKREACVQRVKGLGNQVLVNGEVYGSVYEAIESMVFSEDGSHFGYVGVNGKTISYVCDGKLLGSVEGTNRTRLVFAGDHLVAAQVSEKQVVRVVDGHVADRWDVAEGAKVADVQLTADGAQVVYAETKNGKSQVCCANRSWDTPYAEISGLSISPDGAHLAVAGRKDGFGTAYGLLVDFVGTPYVLRAGAPVFVQNGRLRIPTPDGSTVELVAVGGGWRKVYGQVSADGRMWIGGGTTSVSVNDYTVGYGKYLDAKSPMTGSGYVLIEIPRSLNVNDKELTEVLRVEMAETK